MAILEQITHPEIRRRLNEQVEQLEADGVPLAVLDAPVLLKAGWGDVCDALVFVDCDKALRRSRAVERGWTPDEFAAREAAQENLGEKRKQADFVLENSAETEYTKAQIERLWHCLVG